MGSSQEGGPPPPLKTQAQITLQQLLDRQLSTTGRYSNSTLFSSILWFQTCLVPSEQAVYRICSFGASEAYHVSGYLLMLLYALSVYQRGSGDYLHNIEAKRSFEFFGPLTLLPQVGARGLQGGHRDYALHWS